MASRIVRCRAGASRGPPVSSVRRSANCASSAAGDRIVIRAAASSMASGKPSSRWQISATAAAFRSVGRSGGQRACPLHEQTHGGDGLHLFQVHGAGLRHRQRQHGQDLLALHLQRRPAGGQYLHAPGSWQGARRPTPRPPSTCSQLSRMSRALLVRR